MLIPENVQPRSATDYLAGAQAAEHAATLALAKGDLSRAWVHALIGRLRMDLYRQAAAAECQDCHGRGEIGEPCTDTDCPQAGERHLHFEPCPNRRTHPCIA